MCGAGVLPARMAREARRQGWRVVAFTVGPVEGVDVHADRVVPSRLTEVAPVLMALQEERVSAVLLAGRFPADDVLKSPGDDVFEHLAGRAGSLVDARLLDAVVTTLAGMGVTVLDQRLFVGDWLCDEGCWTATRPTDAEWADVRRGLDLARQAADGHVGQTVVLKRGVVAAVEALEGTTAAIRRGTSLAGPGAVVVKAVAADHDYRFDTPAVGPETIEAAASGRAAVVAIEAQRVLIVDRGETVRRADAAGIALVCTGGGGRRA